QRRKARAQLLLMGRDDFGSSGRCGRSQVRGKIGDREIRLMTDGRDHRNLGFADCARDHLFIESPEVFNRTATPSDNHDVYTRVDAALAYRPLMMFVQKSNCADDFMRSNVTLHASCCEQNVDSPGSPRNYVQDVSQRCAICRSHYADAARKYWDRAFQLRREQTFGLQPCFSLFECQLQRARADWFERLDNELVLAFGLVDAQTSPRANLHPIFETKTNPLIAASIAG